MAKNKISVIDANIEYHTRLVENDYEQQPYYHPDNKKRIKKILEKYKGDSFLDIGCGTGFLLEMSTGFFKNCQGIDITPAMLEVTKNKGLNVTLTTSDNLPFDNNTFDMVACNSFLHHLETLEPTLKEAYRVLKPTGVFYADQEPNYYFYKMLIDFEGKTNNYVIKDEYIRTIKEEEIYSENFDIDMEIVELAEYQKIEGGFKEEKLKKIFEDQGYLNFDINYHWYLGEKNEKCQDINNYLLKYLPATRHLFKYFYIIAYKK